MSPGEFDFCSVFAAWPFLFAETSGPGMHPVGGGGRVDQLPLGARPGTAPGASGRGLDEGDRWGGGRGSGWPQKGGFKANRTPENSGNTHKIGRLTKIGGNHQEKIGIFCSKMGKLTSKVGISLANMRI